MSDNLTHERAKAIVGILDEYPNGTTVGELRSRLPDAPETRVLTKWLARIQDGGAVTVEGTGEAALVRSTAPHGTIAGNRVDAGRGLPPSPTQPAGSGDPAHHRAANEAVGVPPKSPSTPDAVTAQPPSAAAGSGDPALHPTLHEPSNVPAAAPTPDPSVDLVDKAVRYFVGLGMVPEPGQVLLQQGAREAGLSGPAIDAFVQRTLALLATLSETDAATTYGLTAEQYRVWVEHCAIAGYPRRGAAPPPRSHPTSVPPPAREEPVATTKPAPHGTTAAPAAPSVNRPVRRPAPPPAAVAAPAPRHLPSRPAAVAAPAPKPAPVSAASEPSPYAAVSDADTAAEPLDVPFVDQLRAAKAESWGAVQGFDWSRLWSTPVVVRGHTLSGRRLLVAALWAGLCLWFFQHHVAFTASLSAFAVVVVALPFLFLLWLDRKLAWAAALQAVGVGGPLLYLIGDRVRAVGEWVIPRAWHLGAAAVALFTTTPRPTDVGAAPPTRTPPPAAPAPDAPRPAPAPDPIPAPAPAPVVYPPGGKSEEPKSENVGNSESGTGNAETGTRNPDTGKPTPPARTPSENRDSKIENPWPSFPTAAGAYVLSDGRWVALPNRDSQVIPIDDGRPQPADSAGLLIFVGPQDDPVLPANGGVLIWVGAKPWTAAQVKRYPLLQSERFYPTVELTALEQTSNGARCVWLHALLPGITGMGDDARVPVTLDHPTATVTVLRPTVPLRAGYYGLINGAQAFEVVVRDTP